MRLPTAVAAALLLAAPAYAQPFPVQALPQTFTLPAELVDEIDTYLLHGGTHIEGMSLSRELHQAITGPARARKAIDDAVAAALAKAKADAKAEPEASK